MVQNGKEVKVHYKGTLKDGTVFDSSEGKDPLCFKVGEGKVIPGFEKAITEMEEGQTRTIEIPSDQAYGPKHEEMIVTVPKNKFPENIDPKEGMMLKMQSDQETIPMVVTGITEDEVKLDANHPLAGKDLTFELTLLEVSETEK